MNLCAPVFATAVSVSVAILGVELSIIIVNWNGGELLRRAVESIVASPPSVEYEVVVVDNASTDESVTLLSSSDASATLTGESRLRIVKNERNLGFGQANNQAFALTDTPFVLLLNPDTEVTPGSIDCLVATVRSAERIGVVGPKLLNALLLGGHWDHSRKRRVPMLSGAAMLVRRTVIEEVGGFDERFHMYGEDNEWCLRIERAGWQLLFQPDAVILHHGAQSSLQRWNNLEKLRIQMEANYSFQQQSLPRRRLITNLLASYVTASGQHLWRRLRGVQAPDVKLAREIHWAHLKRSLRNKNST